MLTRDVTFEPHTKRHMVTNEMKDLHVHGGLKYPFPMKYTLSKQELLNIPQKVG
jgi:hypothetical protein